MLNAYSMDAPRAKPPRARAHADSLPQIETSLHLLVGQHRRGAGLTGGDEIPLVYSGGLVLILCSDGGPPAAFYLLPCGWCELPAPAPRDRAAAPRAPPQLRRGA